MKKGDVQIQFQQSTSSFLLTVLFCVCAFSVFSQVNPWKIPSKENPWENPSKENPWENKTNSESKKNNTNIDSTIISNTDSNVVAIPTYAALSLKSIERISRNEYKASSAFVGSFVSSGIFLIFALPVNMLTSLVPTKKVDLFVENYKKQLNNPSKEQIKAVKKGIQKKRSLNSLGGSLAGMGTGFAFWLILLNL